MIQLTLFFQWFLYCTGIVWNTWQLQEPNMNIQALLAVSDETVVVATDIGIYRIDQGKGQFVYFTENVIALGNSPRQPQLVYALSTDYYESSILRSEDAGISWKRLPLKGWARCMLVAPDEPNTLYVGFWQEPTLLKSTDGGHTWISIANGILQPLDPQDITNIDELAGTSRYIYAIFGTSDKKLAVSSDGGENWEEARLPQDDLRLLERILQVPDPDTPKVAYARGYNGLYKTTDGGYNWEFLSSRRGRIEDYLVHPLNPKYQYVAQWTPIGTHQTILLYASEDEGRSWQNISFPATTSYKDSARIWLAPQSVNSFYLTLLRGYIARSNDKGASWQVLYDGQLKDYNLRTIGVTDRGWLLIGSETTNHGMEALWKGNNAEYWKVVSSLPVFRIFLDSTQPDLIYGLGIKLYRSADGGQNWIELPIGWEDLNLHPDDTHILTLVPGNPAHLLTIQKGGYAESYDRGDTWIFKPTSWQILQLAITADARRLYALVRPEENGLSGVHTRQPNTWLFQSIDGGKTWEDLYFRQRAYGMPDFLAVHPTRPGYLYLNTPTGFFISTNDGLSWEWIPELEGGMVHRKIHRFLFHPVLPDKLYLMWRDWDNEKKVFTSDDAGRTWRNISTGLVFLEGPESGDMTIAPTSPYSLYVLTGQGSIWSYTDLNAQMSMLHEVILGHNAALLPNYPNPVVQKGVWIPYRLEENGDVSLEIYNVQGRKIRTLHAGHQFAGIYQSPERAFYWNGCNEKGELVANGVYFYTLRFNGQSVSRKLVILR